MKDNNNAYRAKQEDHISLLDMFDAITNTNTNTTHTKSSSSSRSKGMSCASAIKKTKRYKWTNWAHRSILWTFRVKHYAREKYSTNNNNNDGSSRYNFQSDHRPMGEWIKYVSSSMSTTITDSTLSVVKQASTPVLSKEYLEHAVQSVDEFHGYYYNFTHDGLPYPKEALRNNRM